MNSISPRAGIGAHFLHTSRQASPGLVSSVVIAAAITTLVLFSGCRSMSPLDVTTRSLVSTVQSVDAAMQSYADLVALGLVSERDQVKVGKLYADYQAAESVAETALLNALKTRDAGSLAAATAALDAAKLPLLQFLARFTTSPP